MAAPIPITLLQVQYIDQGDSVYKVLVPQPIEDTEDENIVPDDDYRSVNPIICQVQNAEQFQTLCSSKQKDKPSLTSFVDLSSKFKTVKSLVKLKVKSDFQGKNQVIPDKRSLLTVDVSKPPNEVIELLSPDVNISDARPTTQQCLQSEQTNRSRLSSTSQLDKEVIDLSPPATPEIIEIGSPPRQSETTTSTILSKQGFLSQPQATPIDRPNNILGNFSRSFAVTTGDPNKSEHWNTLMKKLDDFQELGRQHEQVANDFRIFKSKNVSPNVSKTLLPVLNNTKARPIVTTCIKSTDVTPLTVKTQEVISKSTKAIDVPMFTIGSVWSLSEEQEAVLNIPVALPSIEFETMVPIPEVKTLTRTKICNEPCKDTKHKQLPNETNLTTGSYAAVDTLSNISNQQKESASQAVAIERILIRNKPESLENSIPTNTIDSKNVNPKITSPFEQRLNFTHLPENKTTSVSNSDNVQQKHVSHSLTKPQNAKNPHQFQHLYPTKNSRQGSIPVMVNLAKQSTKTYTQEATTAPLKVSSLIVDSKWEAVVKQTSILKPSMHVRQKNEAYASFGKELQAKNCIPISSKMLNECMDNSPRTNIAIVAPLPSDKNHSNVQKNIPEGTTSSRSHFHHSSPNKKTTESVTGFAHPTLINALNQRPVSPIAQEIPRTEITAKPANRPVYNLPRLDKNTMPKPAISIVDKIASILKVNYENAFPINKENSASSENLVKAAPEVVTQNEFTDCCKNIASSRGISVYNGCPSVTKSLGSPKDNFSSAISRFSNLSLVVSKQKEIVNNSFLSKHDDSSATPRSYGVDLGSATLEQNCAQNKLFHTSEDTSLNSKENNNASIHSAASSRSTFVPNTSDLPPSKTLESLKEICVLEKEIKQEIISKNQNELDFTTPKEHKKLTSSDVLDKVIKKELISSYDDGIFIEPPQEPQQPGHQTAFQDGTVKVGSEVLNKPQQGLTIFPNEHSLKNILVDAKKNASYEKGLRNAESAFDKLKLNPFPNWNPKPVPTPVWDPQFIIKKESKLDDSQESSSNTSLSEEETTTSSSDEQCKQIEMKLTIARLKSRTTRTKKRLVSSKSDSDSSDEKYVSSRTSKTRQTRNAKVDSTVSLKSKPKNVSKTVVSSIPPTSKTTPQIYCSQNVDLSEESYISFTTSRISQSRNSKLDSSHLDLITKESVSKTIVNSVPSTSKPTEQKKSSERSFTDHNFRTKNTGSEKNPSMPKISAHVPSSQTYEKQKHNVESKTYGVNMNESSTLTEATSVQKSKTPVPKQVKRNCSSPQPITPVTKQAIKRTYCATISRNADVIDLQVVKPCYVRLEKLNWVPTVRSTFFSLPPELTAVSPLPSSKRKRKRKRKSKQRCPKLQKQAENDSSEGSPPPKCIVFSPDTSSIEDNERLLEDTVKSSYDPSIEETLASKYASLLKLVEEKSKLLESYRKKFGGP